VPNSRYTAVVRFDGDSLDDAKSFARGIRRSSRNRNRHEWERRDARLLRVKAPEGYGNATGKVTARFEAVVKFNAVSLTDAQSFARDVRHAARAGVNRTRYGGYLRQWAERDAKLLRIVDPTVATAPAAVQQSGEAASTAEVIATEE
jgi:hypothetical protein